MAERYWEARWRDEKAHNETLLAALKEAERFMAYFSGETDGVFAGPGMPSECLKQIRDAIAWKPS